LTYLFNICKLSDNTIPLARSQSLLVMEWNQSQIEAFCIMTPFNVAVGYQRLEGPYFLMLLRRILKRDLTNQLHGADSLLKS